MELGKFREQAKDGFGKNEPRLDLIIDSNRENFVTVYAFIT